MAGWAEECSGKAVRIGSVQWQGSVSYVPDSIWEKGKGGSLFSSYVFFTTKTFSHMRVHCLHVQCTVRDASSSLTWNLISLLVTTQVTGQKVEVNVGEDRLVVEAPRNLLDVFVPVSLDSDKAKAFFITSSKVRNLSLIDLSWALQPIP